jgi:ankyrin repeat protein
MKDPNKYQPEDPFPIGTTDMRSPDSAAIHRAVMRRNLPELAQALAEGEAVDALDKGGRTALFYAVMEGDSAIVEELIRHGANPNAQDKNLETPLHFAAREYQLAAAKRLIEEGANPNAQDNHGNTPLGRAVFESRGRGDMIKLLLSAGADKYLKNKHGTSPNDLAGNIANYDVSIFLQ